MKILLVGGGVSGKTLAGHLVGEGHDVVIIEKDPENAKKLADSTEALIINGDASDMKILKNAGIDDTKAMVVLTHEDNTNMLISQLAIKLGVPNIIVRVNDPGNKEVFSDMEGVKAISPTLVVVTYLKNAITGGGGRKKRSVLSLATGKVEVLEFNVPEKLDQKRTDDLDLPKGTILPLIIRHGEPILCDEPRILKVGDDAVIIAKTDDIEGVIKVFE